MDIRNEYYFFNKECRALAVELKVSHDYEGAFGLHLAFPFVFSWFLSLDFDTGERLLKWCGKYRERAYGFSICNQYIFLKCHYDWMDSMGGGWSFIKEWEDLLKGSHNYDSEEIGRWDEVKYMVPAAGDYPEKEQVFDVICNRVTLTYPRWFTKIGHRWEVECKDGVKHQGKGTAAHNCGEDACYSTTFAMDSPEINTKETAIEGFIKGVNKNRQNYPL